MLNKSIVWLLTVGVIVSGFLELQNLLNGSAHDKAIATGYFIAIFYTLIFGFLLRKIIQKLFTRFSNTILLFTIIGSLGAALVETSIWFAQTLYETTGAAISSNIWVDLIMTMPFYILLTFFFAKLATRYWFSWKIAAISGGFYEIIADGVIGNLFIGNVFGILLAPFLFPIFIVVYSPIILTPFLLLSPRLVPTQELKGKKYLKLLWPTLAVLILPISIFLGYLLDKTLK